MSTLNRERLADLSWRLCEEGRFSDADLINAALDGLAQFAGEGAGGGSAVVETLHSGSPASEMRTDAVPSPVPAAPSLVERLRDIPKPDLLGTHSADCWQWHEHCARLEAADRIEELEAEMAIMHRSVVHECCEKVQELEAALADPEPKTLGTAGNTMTSAWKPDRPDDLASDDRLIPLPGGRIAVAAQDLRVGDAVDGSIVYKNGWAEMMYRSELVTDCWELGTLVLLDKAAES